MTACDKQPDPAIVCVGSSGDSVEILDDACTNPCPVSNDNTDAIKLAAKSLADADCASANLTTCTGTYGAIATTCETINPEGIPQCSSTSSVDYAGTCS